MRNIKLVIEQVKAGEVWGRVNALLVEWTESMDKLQGINEESST